MLLDEVPAARADDERRGLLVQRIVLLAGVERDRSRAGVDEVGLAVDDVLPRRRVRVLEVGHEDARTRVERVDHHLAVDRPRDLDAALAEVGGRLGDAPVRVADGARLRQEVRQLTGPEPVPALGAGGEQLAAGRIELALEGGDEVERLGRQDLGRSSCRGANDRDPGRRGHRHLRIPRMAAP